MTSASELFYTRRSRIGRNPELGFGSPPDRNSPHHFHHRHHHHRHNRHEDDSDSPRRGSLHARHLCHRVSQTTERESVHIDHGSSQNGTGNSSNSENSRSRTNRQRFSRDDRLPGAVLEARARLLERLRGISLTGNRESSTSSGISSDEFVASDNFRIADDATWEGENELRELFPPVEFADSSLQTDQSLFLLGIGEKKPPGLSEESIDALNREVFHVNKEAEGFIEECCICLERYWEGDGVTMLPCGHRFHSVCLYPWVQTCGDCPYCRTGIVVNGEEGRDEASKHLMRCGRDPSHFQSA